MCWHDLTCTSVVQCYIACPGHHVVQEKYGDQDDSDSSSSEIEDDTAYVSVIFTGKCVYM